MKIVANNRKKTSEDSSFQIKKKINEAFEDYKEPIWRS